MATKAASADDFEKFYLNEYSGESTTDIFEAAAAYAKKREAATIERCAQIAEAAAENEHTMMLGLRKNGLGEATVGSEKLVKLGKSVAAAIRSMKGAE